MRYVTLALLALFVGIAACDGVDTTGLQRASDHLGGLVDDLEVATADCTPNPTLVGDVGVCVARNAAATRLQTGSFPLVSWESSAPAVVSMDVDGQFEALAAGTAIITAHGSDLSLAQDTITVQ